MSRKRHHEKKELEPEQKNVPGPESSWRTRGKLWVSPPSRQQQAADDDYDAVGDHSD